ncbi:MAG: MerR family transcriptional regulator [Sphingobacteriales bacterium]|nr:MAG: MerR family transcriptional regulator [Sphingobacteriales bacterium]
MQEFHVTDRTLRRWKTENLIESRTLGRKVYYSKSSIEQILKR